MGGDGWMSDASELITTERNWKTAWALFGENAKLTDEEIAEMTGLKLSGARTMMEKASRKSPVAKINGRWQKISLHVE